MSAVNVLRYSALGLGIFYGFTHQRKITAADKAAHDKQEYQRKQALIDQAKAEYARKNNPAPANAGDGVIRDPMDPKFDLEAYFGTLMKEFP